MKCQLRTEGLLTDGRGCDDAAADDFAAVDRDLAAAVVHEQCTRLGIDPGRISDDHALADLHLYLPTGRDLPGGPAGHVKPTRTQRLVARLEAGEESVEQDVVVNRSAMRELAQAGHLWGEVGWKVGRRPVGIYPDPD